MSDQSATASERLNPESARALVERNYELLNEHDTRLIPTCFTEDVVFHDGAWPETIKGHIEMERFLTAVWRAAPDFRFELLDGPYLAEDGRSAAVRVRASGTMTGPYDPPGFGPTNTRIATEFAGFYEFEEGRIKRARIIVNMNDVGIQMGAAPPPGSRGERLAVAMQRLIARLRRRRTKA